MPDATTTNPNIPDKPDGDGTSPPGESSAPDADPATPDTAAGDPETVGAADDGEGAGLASDGDEEGKVAFWFDDIGSWNDPDSDDPAGGTTEADDAAAGPPGGFRRVGAGGTATGYNPRLTRLVLAVAAVGLLAGLILMAGPSGDSSRTDAAGGTGSASDTGNGDSADSATPGDDAPLPADPDELAITSGVAGQSTDPSASGTGAPPDVPAPADGDQYDAGADGAGSPPVGVPAGTGWNSPAGRTGGTGTAAGRPTAGTLPAGWPASAGQAPGRVTRPVSMLWRLQILAGRPGRNDVWVPSGWRADGRAESRVERSWRGDNSDADRRVDRRRRSGAELSRRDGGNLCVYPHYWQRSPRGGYRRC